MSVWTQVDFVMEVPEPVTREILEKTFGKEMNLMYAKRERYYRRTEDGYSFDSEAYELEEKEAMENNKREWDMYKGHEDEYLPCGSEGTLYYDNIRRAARKTKDGKYRYTISGSLRDFSDDEYIIRYFRDGFLKLANQHKEWLFNDYAKVSASMGVGELVWEYGML